jgi:ABC-type transport system involved in multi-copper enzyme maturation permease subunit
MNAATPIVSSDHAAKPNEKHRSMLARIAAFEFRYQLKNPVFWVTAGLFFLFSYGFVASDRHPDRRRRQHHENGPFSILQTNIIFSIFFMFVTTAFVANVIVRDDDTGYGPIVRSTRVTKFDYLIGRFIGAVGIAALAFTAIPLGIFIGSLMPWLDPETLGPNRIGDYLFGYFVFALPNILITSAILFALATLTRSMMTTYLGVVVLLVPGSSPTQQCATGRSWKARWHWPSRSAPAPSAMRHAIGRRPSATRSCRTFPGRC